MTTETLRRRRATTVLAFLVVCGAGLCRGSSSEASDSGSHAGQEAETPVRRYFGQDVSCTADASFNCGWLYIPADMEAKQLFSPGIYELSSFPGSGICTDVCLEVINSAKCKEQRDLLAEACDALQCSKNVRLSCGVHGNGTVDWDRACTTECEAAMQNSTCKTAGRVFEEFSTYNNSFGLTGRECKVYACGKHLEEHCREYNSTFLSMPIQSLCNGACYDALRSDTCRLPNQMKMLLSDGTMENWTEYADARYYGPNMTVCKSIYEGSVTDMVEFIPNPARLPATPPRPNCTALSPWDLCVVFVGPLPALAPNLTTVSFSASLTFREAPQGFENRWQYLYRRGLLQADTGVNVSWANSFAVGPTLVDVPEEFAKDYRQLVADYASDPPNNVTVDPQTDTVVHNCSQTFYVSGDFQNSIVTIILETSVTFRGNEERAQWFSGNIRQDIAKIFQSWGVLHGAVGGSGAMDPYNIISNKESTISMPTPSTQVPSAPPAITGNLLSAEDDDNTRGRPAWLIWTLVAGGVASLLACAAAIALVFRHYSSSKRIDSSAVMAGSDESLHTEASRRSLDEAGGWQERGTATFNNPLWSAGPDESINTGQTAAQDKHRHDPDDPDSGDMFMSRSPVASPETASCSSGPIMGQQTAWNEGHSRQQTRATFSMVTAPGRRSHERKKIAGGDADQPLLAEAAAICTDPSEPSSENRHGSDEFKAVRPADGTRYRPT